MNMEDWLSFFLRGVSEQARDGVYLMEKIQEIRVTYQDNHCY